MFPVINDLTHFVNTPKGNSFSLNYFSLEKQDLLNGQMTAPYNIYESHYNWKTCYMLHSGKRKKSPTEQAGQNHSPFGTSNSAGRRQYKWNGWLHSSHNNTRSSSPFLRHILHFYGKHIIT
jgi:hypothetical protein